MRPHGASDFRRTDRDTVAPALKLGERHVVAGLGRLSRRPQAPFLATRHQSNRPFRNSARPTAAASKQGSAIASTECRMPVGPVKETMQARGDAAGKRSAFAMYSLCQKVREDFFAGA